MSGYGLMQMGSSMKNSALGGLKDAAALEDQRKQTNDALKAQKRATETQSAASGAASGAMIGMMAGGGPPGAVVGGAIGLLGGYLLS